MTFDLKNYLENRRAMVETALERVLPPEAAPPTRIHQAMRYSVLAPGKRLRPILVVAGAEAVGGRAETVLDTACALELIHAYSLIHDDLPAMDDDDYRRGRLTNHKVFGEAVAILAGDALLTLAFRLVASNAARIAPGVVGLVVAEVADAAGTDGMVGGQVVDIESEGKTISAEMLDYIHCTRRPRSSAWRSAWAPCWPAGAKKWWTPSAGPARRSGSRFRSWMISSTSKAISRSSARPPEATSASRRRPTPRCTVCPRPRRGRATSSRRPSAC